VRLDIAVKGGRIVGVRGRALDRVNRGRLGPKGLFGWQANNAPDRLTRPLIRRNGALVETDWETAMGAVVERSKDLLGRFGPLTFGFYTTGQFFIEDFYTQCMMVRAGIGSPHMDGNTRLCTATAATSPKETFGSDGQPGSFTDIEHCDTLFHVGHNLAENQTVFWMRVLDRLRGEDPPRVLVVDPRPTPTAREATVHLSPRPGTNIPLMNALQQQLIANGWIDTAYIDAHTIHFDKLRDVVMPMLLILGIWRHIYEGFPLKYDPAYWGAVFPLGMYTACTVRLAHALRLPFLLVIPQFFIYVALAAWLLVILGFVRSLVSSAAEHADLPQAGTAGSAAPGRTGGT